jgi:carboxylesterase
MDGCVVIHGLTGTPATVACIKDGLLKAGYRVSAPCLAGHGGSMEDLARVSWREWYDTVRIAYNALRRDVDRVYCVGSSLGALLSLKLAIDEGWGVRALALLGTPMRLSMLNRIALPVVCYSPLRWIVKAVPKSMEKNLADPEAREMYAELSTPMIPVRAALELNALREEVETHLGRVANPLLMLHALKDRVAPIKHLRIVKSGVKSDIIEIVPFSRSRHVIAMDYEKDDVLRATVDFFRRFA